MHEKLDSPSYSIEVNGITAHITPEEVSPGRWNVFVFFSGAEDAVPVGHEDGPFVSYEEAKEAGEKYARAEAPKFKPR